MKKKIKKKIEKYVEIVYNLKDKIFFILEKKMKKILFSVIIIFIVSVGGIFNFSYADNNTNDSRSQSINQVISSADKFISDADTNYTISQNNMQTTIDLLYNVFLGIGLIVAVICGIVLGIQFMISSAEGQAQIKEKLKPYVTGCVIIFGAFGIWKIIMVLLGSV